MVELAKVIGPLSGALGLSLIVERVLEFLKNIFEPRVGMDAARKTPGKRARERKIEELRHRHELARHAQEMDGNPEAFQKKMADLKTEAANERNPESKKRKLQELEKMRGMKELGEWNEQYSLSSVLVLPATDADDGTTLRAFVIQMIGFAVGILMARFSDVALFRAFLGYEGHVVWWDCVLTGLLIGGGSAPVHLLIRFITERKVTEAEESSASEEKKAAVLQQTSSEEGRALPAIIAVPSGGADENLNIPYAGGVDRDLLEDVHIRDKNPDMVVFHHTAMSSRSTFEDVVNVIKNRTDKRGKRWLTGYNCVVLSDGSIHAFCRWDRYGSHAVGYNQRSLGISFNGNFETSPNVPFSNPSGKYGPPRPTEQQLKAGARVVTLWTFLYPDIAVDFDKSIRPHGELADKACPGSLFPYEQFRKWVEFYRVKWEKSASAQEQIELFKQKPYLYRIGGRP